jgi:hypothetical protein
LPLPVCPSTLSVNYGAISGTASSTAVVGGKGGSGKEDYGLTAGSSGEGDSVAEVSASITGSSGEDGSMAEAVSSIAVSGVAVQPLLKLAAISTIATVRTRNALSLGDGDLIFAYVPCHQTKFHTEEHLTLKPKIPSSYLVNRVIHHKFQEK